MTGREQERAAALVLARLVEPGTWTVVDAVRAEGVEQVVAALRTGRRPGQVSARLAEGARGRAEGVDPQRELDRLRATGARVVLPGDAEWPPDRLHWEGAVLEDAPPVALVVRGEAPLAAAVEDSVALVGARACTAYGAHVAGDLAAGLADAGWSVVSGGAYGIDAAAHRGALASGRAPTVAVLACGVDLAYPRGNEQLLERVAADGLVVSEHAPGTTPTRGRFLVRNRLIAALTRGTVVVEAAARSGSLSTAHRAQALGRQVGAVPGPVTSAMSVGCHALVRDGAVLVQSAREVLGLCGPLGATDDEPERGPERPRDALPQLVRQVLEAVPFRGGAGEATIAQASGVPVPTVLQVLPPLLVAGLVERCDTGWRLTPLGAGRPVARR